jgi:hypothetical protein
MAKGPHYEELKFIPIPLNGKWIPAADGTELGQGDFQVLTNMRYGEVAPKTVAGMTKVNSTPLGAIKNGIHFKKDQVAESHVMVQAVNGGSTSLYSNDTAIPNQGNFNAALWNDTAGAGLGRFSSAPDGCMVYCNGVDTLVYGGNEYRCGAFLCGSSDATVIYANYTTAVNNTLTDAGNIAYPAAGTGPYFYTFVGSTRPIAGAKFYVKTPSTAVSTLAVSYWANGSWHTVSGLVDGTKVSNKTLAQTGTVNFTSTVGTAQPILINQTYAYFYRFEWGSPSLTATVYQATLVAPIQPIVDLWDGMQRPVASFLSTLGVAPLQYDDFTTQVYKQDYVAGNPATYCNLNDYNSNGTSFLLIGFSERINAFYAQFDSRKINRVGSSGCTVYYWNGGAWAAATGVKDGTILNNIEFAQSGLISWDAPAWGTEFPQSTSPNGPSFYYYKIVFNTSNAILLSTVGNSGGTGYSVGSTFTVNGGSTLATGTVTSIAGGDNHVTGWSWTSQGAGYSVANNVATTTTGGGGSGLTINITSLAPSLCADNLGGAGTVTVASGTSSLNGVGTNFTRQLTTGNVVIPTGGKPHVIASVINDTLAYIEDTWEASFTGVSFILNSYIALNYIYGIPTQNQIRPYKFPLYWQNRVVLCNDQSQNKNQILLSSSNTVNVFNGTDSVGLVFGDNTDIVAGASLFARFGGSIYENLILCKNNETWVVDGTSVASYVTYKISESYGCAAPLSLAVCSMGYGVDGAINKHVAIWLSSSGIVMFDLNSVNRIDMDIGNYFDTTQPEYINETYLEQSVGWFDEQYHEYHIIIPSGAAATGLNTELVYDLMSKRWYQVDRTDGNIIRCAFPVIDTSGNKYVYGGMSSGYLEYLEDGETFDGAPIASEFKTVDIPMAGMGVISEIRSFKLIARAKNTTTNKVAVTHYADTANAASDTLSLSLADASHRVVQNKQTVNWQNGVFHAIDCKISTSNEACGFEPIALGVFVKPIRDDLK